MKNRKTIRKVALLCSTTAVVALSSSQVFAAGFEKALFWDAHYSGIAGAAQSSVVGPQSVYWNPAGLAGTEGMQVNGDFSPTLAKFNGVVPNATGEAGGNNAGTPVSSSTGFDPVGAAFVSYQITDKWVAGLGYYVVGGTKANYDSVNLTFPGVTYTPPIQGNLAITELGLGTGYEVLPGLKVGATYRVTFVHADLDDATASGGSGVTAYHLNGLSATSWNGFKLGAIYAPKDSGFGFGVTWRSRVNFSATSNNVNITNAAPSGLGNPAGQALGGSNGTAGLNLPMRIDAAAHYQFMPSWTGFLGYSFTNLTQDQFINEEIDGSSAPAALTSTRIPLNWVNQHNIRVALEYAGIQDWMIRGGYVWTNQVTPASAALPILAAPGTGNTFVLGAGHKFSSMLSADAAFEYDRDSGTVANSDVTPGTRTGAGDFSAKDYVLHVSATLSL